MSSSKPKYNIKPYSYSQAEKLGVQIFASDNPRKKIEVYDSEGNFICYIGDSQFLDYPSYMELEDRGLAQKGYAKERRRLYKIRHKKDMDKEGTPSFFASRILW
jgi:hypothetical protein